MEISPRCRTGSEALTLGCAIYPTPCSAQLVDQRVITPRVGRELQQLVENVAHAVGAVMLKAGLPPDAAIALMLSLAASWAEEQELDRSAALAIMGLRSSDQSVDTTVMLNLVRRLRKRTRRLCQ